MTKTETFTVKIDPRYAKDGITVADLAEQTKFALKVRDALAEARQLAQTRASGASTRRRGDQAKLQERLGAADDEARQTAYEDQMFIDQMSNVEPRDRSAPIRRSARAPTSGSTS